jgi:hypothetical protein
MPQDMLRVYYAAADFVLANSKHEPFGLVGLEAMAAGGLVFTGPTGETYSIDGAGAMALDTEQAGEIVLAIENLRANPEKAQVIRRMAPAAAARYTWDNVAAVLFEKICLARNVQKVHPFRTSLFIPHLPIQRKRGKPEIDQSQPLAWPIPMQMQVDLANRAGVR